MLLLNSPGAFLTQVSQVCDGGRAGSGQHSDGKDCRKIAQRPRTRQTEATKRPKDASDY